MQFELPELAANITEYQGHARTCPCCGHLNRSEIPPEICAHVIGPRMAAVMSYLSGRHHIGRRGVEEIAATIFEVPTSLGSVSALEGETSAALASPYGHPSHPSVFPHHGIQRITVEFSEKSRFCRNHRPVWCHTERRGPLIAIGLRSVFANSAVDIRQEPAGEGSVPCLNPLVLESWGPGAGEQRPDGRWGPTRFAGCQRLGGCFLSNADLWAGWG